MKKIKFFTIPVLIVLFIFTACNSDRQKQTINENSPKSVPVQINADAEIIVFDNQKLYYFMDKTGTPKTDLEEKTLFEYNFIDKKSRNVSSFADISTFSGSTVLVDNTLYIPLATNIQNILVKINIEKGSWETIKRWETFPPISYVYSIKNNLILFGPNSINSSTTDYYINKMNLNGKEEKNIVKKRIKNKNGELISCIDVDENSIYAFSITSNGNDESYSIIKYDMNGKQCSTYPLDLKFFLNPVKTLVDQDDAISGIYKEKDYFILNSLNGRVFIFKLINNKLQSVKIPENFYKDNPSGFRFMDYHGDSDFAYFYNTFKSNNEVSVFNYSSGKISSFEIPEHNKIYSYIRNAHGDLIIKTSNDQNSNPFYYINYSMLSNK